MQYHLNTKTFELVSYRSAHALMRACILQYFVVPFVPLNNKIQPTLGNILTQLLTSLNAFFVWILLTSNTYKGNLCVILCFSRPVKARNPMKISERLSSNFHYQNLLSSLAW